MATQVLYRKWRPQRFADLVGQEHVNRTLLNALSAGRVAHAYLFCGPRGTGKTSMGRILAKAVNCRDGGQGEPCGRCHFCTAVAEGRALDLIEIDAASNRGIDEIRSLREKVNFAPNEARYKVYIVDEVHMLTKEAFNALLKTLEEPPPHAIFVLATTEAHKLPATVVSRCQRFDFRRIPLQVVVDRLALICRDEGVEASRDVLVAIARSAGGSLRDAQNVLEQIMVGCGEAIEGGDVREVLGTGGEAHVPALASAALSGDIGAGIGAISMAAQEGVDLGHFHRFLMEHLRGLMLAKAGAADSLDVPEEERQAMREMAGRHPMEAIVKAVRAFGHADLRSSPSPLTLELALVEAVAGTPAQAAAPLPAVSPGPAPQRPRPAQPAAGGPVTARPQAPPPRPLPARGAAPPSVEPRPGAPPPQRAPLPQNGAPPADPQDHLALLRQNWRLVIEGAKGPHSRFRLDALLRSASPLSVEGELVTVGFTHKKFVDMISEELENPGSRRTLEDAVERVIGSRHQVRCVLADQPPRQPRGHLVRAAVDELGAKIIETGGPAHE